MLYPGGHPSRTPRMFAYDVMARGTRYSRAFAFEHLEDFADEY